MQRLICSRTTPDYRLFYCGQIRRGRVCPAWVTLGVGDQASRGRHAPKLATSFIAAQDRFKVRKQTLRITVASQSTRGPFAPGQCFTPACACSSLRGKPSSSACANSRATQTSRVGAVHATCYAAAVSSLPCAARAASVVSSGTTGEDSISMATASPSLRAARRNDGSSRRQPIACRISAMGA
jgi:hypothetical protein